MRTPGLFLIPAGIALLAGLDAALLLAGLPAPVTTSALPDRHGMLMAVGFLGTVIALERAVALKWAWGFAAPGLLGAGVVCLLSPLPRLVGAVVLMDGCVALLAVYAGLFRRQRDEATAVEALGASCALAATLLWLRVEVSVLLAWLVAFVLLTIAAERVELARFQLRPGSEHVLVGLSVACLVAAAASLLFPSVGMRLFGVSVLAMAGWLSVGDVARRTIRMRGLPRFSGAALLAGYGWLAVAAAAWIGPGAVSSPAAYDVAVHAVFLGFAMSMVLAHAPVILPAVIRRPLPYHPVLWVAFAVLHGGLVVRLFLGDVMGSALWWQVGAWLTVVALLLLPVTAAGLVLVGARRAQASRRARLTSAAS